MTKNPQWRDAEHFAERHARTVLAFVDVRVNLDPQTQIDNSLDLVGDDFSGRVEHQRSPVERSDIERLRAAAGATVAVFYSRAGFTKVAVLYAEEHRVALFGYTDSGYASPVNQCATDVVLKAQAESARHVRAATEIVSRHVTAARQETERREREALADALRAEDEARDAAERQRVSRARNETLLGRTVALLLQIQVRPDALRETVEHLAGSTIVSAVAVAAGQMSLGERPHAIALVRSLFEDAAAALELVTPAAARDATSYWASKQAIERGFDALDAADGVGTIGHVGPEDVTAYLRQAERCWRAVADELERRIPARADTGIPEPRRARHLTSTR
ncbi:hypothetical protein [Cellulomonas sp. URHD0024]|uniref:hypothetical protein n=1 Tax=Cellulomonas sp. URHD0024 TaxID=1302620 RepID=UPI0018C987DD|nr:hypothetical protein [Cellulomonas sp. URHD0024]